MFTGGIKFKQQSYLGMKIYISQSMTVPLTDRLTHIKEEEFSMISPTAVTLLFPRLQLVEEV